MNEQHTCFIGLGSNLNDPLAQVRLALDELGQIEGCRLVATSSIYRSAPVGPQDQPDFINAVAQISTSLSPLALLDQLQRIEQDHQRVRDRHWGPRTLDLDILLYGQELIHCNRLDIPHPYLPERNFVLYPLAEIAPNLLIPDMGELKTLLHACSMGSLTKIQV